jgi:hypothetical protein
MEAVMEQEIILKLDKKVVDYLSDDVRKRRQTSEMKAFSDIFLIRLVSALNKKSKVEVFKLKGSKDS